MKKIFFWLVIAVLISSLILFSVGCKGKEVAEEEVAEEEAVEEEAVEEEVAEEEAVEEAGPKMGGVLRIGNTSQTTTLDNHKYSGNRTVVQTCFIYDYLWLPNAEYTELQPRLAKSWNLENETTLAVELRDNIKFHNGEQLTSEDVKATFERIMDPDVGSTHYGFCTSIDNIEVIDDTHFNINFKEYDNGFMSYASRIAIYPKSIIESDPDSFATNPIGCGPFKFVEWIKDSKLVYEKFDDYYIEDFPYLDRVEFIFYADATTMHVAMLNNEIDFVEWSDSANVEEIPKQNPDIEPYYIYQMGDLYISMNMAKDIFKDNPLLRQAIRYALDPRPFAVNYGPGCVPNICTLITDPNFSDVGKWEWDESMYDVEKAKQLLADAGFPNGEGLPAFDCVGSQGGEAFMPELLQAQLAEIGITVNAITPPIAEAFAMWGAGDYDFASLGDTGNGNPGFLLKKYFTPEGGLSYIGNYTYNEELIDLINKINSSSDPQTVRDLSIQAYDIVLEEVPVLYVHSITKPKLIWNYVKDIVVWPDVMADYTGVWMDK